MKSASRSPRLTAETLYGIAISRWHARYGLGSMMPDDPGMDEFMAVDLVGTVLHPAAIAGHPINIFLRHEEFITSLADLEMGSGPLGHLRADRSRVHCEVMIPWGTMPTLTCLAVSGKLRSITLRGTEIKHGTSRIFQIELSTRKMEGAPDMEER